MNLKDVFQKAGVLYRSGFSQCFPLGFVIALANQIAVVVMNNTLTWQGDTPVVKSWPLLFFTLTLGFIVGIMGNAIIQVYQNARIHKQTASFQLGLLYVLAQAPKLILAAIAFSVLASLGFMLYIVPGVLVMVLFGLYCPIILFLNQKPLMALLLSFKLISKNFMLASIVMLLNIILMSGPLMLMDNLPSPLSIHLDFGIIEAFSVLLMGVIYPFVNSLTLILFYELHSSLNFPGANGFNKV